MKKKSIIALHVFIWLFAAFIQSRSLRFENPEQTIGTSFAFLYILGFFYLFYSVFVPRFLAKKQIIIFLIIGIVAILIVPFFGYNILFLNRALFKGSFDGFYDGYSLKGHLTSFVPFTLSATFGSFFKVIVNWFEIMDQKRDIEKQKMVSELSLLKSHLNPHFLFNTLNNIDSLIYQNPKEASKALVKLSGIMRYMTYETASEYVPLHKEVEYMKNIIDLHRLRIRNPALVSFNFEGNSSVLVAPALFLPFIENAFKHAALYDDKPGIDIQLKESNGCISFRISNYFEPETDAPETPYSGTGLENIRRRLELIYPQKYQLQISSEQKLFTVDLTIVP